MSHVNYSCDCKVHVVFYVATILMRWQRISSATSPKWLLRILAQALIKRRDSLLSRLTSVLLVITASIMDMTDMFNFDCEFYFFYHCDAHFHYYYFEYCHSYEYDCYDYSYCVCNPTITVSLVTVIRIFVLTLFWLWLLLRLLYAILPEL